ncbi:sugar ABC transporter ATP-binding protein [Microbacterium oxydans]|uniref:sugar ABC transporter ATP-binding protein n=1 Tax=Microbacterium TaxID=33882 RepID=UPI00187D1121|nr:MULTISPECIES: sugar ABC transporter ATP-binding protein [Microbacterium]MBE7956300.1 sugar ABC transporter ATP-binding protein [Microbacterium sp. R1]MCK8476409.1 sugar ABC transporter ATP-binding protein [Microbacterium aurugineum]
MTTPAPFLNLTNIAKSFDGVHALRDIAVTIRRGTVHALVGENGAGKSTLGKVIAGVHGEDQGTIEIDGVRVSFSTPRDALRHGITIVAQELALVPTRSVIENVYLGTEPHIGPFVRTRALRSRYATLTEDSGIFVDPFAYVGDLSIADQQKVEILRALARGSSLIVMDEPTARLATHEAFALRRIVKQLRDAGATIVYVSHFLEEVLDIADDITVLRDGRVIRSGAAAVESPQTLIESMIGRPLAAAFPSKQYPEGGGRTMLEVSGLSGRGFHDVSLQVSPGEIVALTGLVGSGRTEVVRALFGADRSTSGTVLLDGSPYLRRKPWRSVERGIALLPESRKLEGLFLSFSISDNVSLASLKKFSRGGFVRTGRERAAVSERLAEVDVRMRNATDPVGLLSGGNQQKTMFAKSLLTRPRLLIIDEPTRGVDVGAKRQIYDLIVRLAQEGMAVLVVSSEMEEVIGIAHRVAVMRQGEIVGTLAGDDVTEHAIALLAFGSDGLMQHPQGKE